jgi:hypothetical protein
MAEASPSPQVVASSSSDTQPIQNQSGDGKDKDPAITSPVQSVVKNQQKYPAIRDLDGNLAGWAYLVITS